MNAQEEFKTYKLLVEKQLKKNKTISSIVLGVAAMLSVIFMIYGFTQSIEAQRQNYELGVTKHLLENAERDITNLRGQLTKCETERNKY